MSLRLRTACLLAVLLGTGVIPVAAKPPDLPAKPTITCHPQTIAVQEAGTGALLFGVGVNSDAGLTGSLELIPSEDEAAWDCADCPLCAGLASCWRAVVDCFVSAEKPAPPPCNCPYLQQQATAPQPVPADAVTGLTNGVLDNLEKLEKAHKLYRKAEHYRRTGRFDTACEYYERVQEICPGSRYDRLAATRLRTLYAQHAVETAHGGCEEQEVLPMPHKVGEPNANSALPWSAACPDPLLPSLFAVPAEGEDAAPCPELKELLCRILALAAAGGCAELDASNPEGLRLHCTVQVGDFGLEMTVEKDGRCHLKMDWTEPRSVPAKPPVKNEK